jgi:hypothetical protein
MSRVSEEAPPEQWSGPLLNTEEAAARSRLARQTMAIHRLRGTGCPYVKLGSRCYYYADQLDAWIASKRRKSTSDHSAARTPAGGNGRDPLDQALAEVRTGGKLPPSQDDGADGTPRKPGTNGAPRKPATPAP